MMFADPHKIISETASADLLDPEVDQEVKDVVNDLQDTLTTNVEEVPAEDKEDNHAVLSADELKESCMLWEGNGRYYMDVRDLMRICEAEEEETGEAPDAGQVATDVAETNDVDSDDLVIVAPADVASELIEAALNEAKAGKKGGKAAKKLNDFKGLLDDVKSKGIGVVRVGKSKKKSSGKKRKKRR